MLLYTDYLQEVNLYMNRLQLAEFQVSLKTYKLLQKSSLMNQENLKSMMENSNLENNELIIDEDESFTGKDFFSLNPPFPEIDLSVIGPIFLENGIIHLSCEYSFDCIRCTVAGEIVANKIYLSNTYFNNPNCEIIGFSFDFKNFREFFQLKINLHDIFKDKNNKVTHDNKFDKKYQNIIYKNVANINLFSNYIMLLGSHGSNIDVFSDERSSASLEYISKKYNYYRFIETQVSLLFVIVYLKIINFFCLMVSFGFLYLMHLPLYLLTLFNKREFSYNDQSSSSVSDGDLEMESYSNNNIFDEEPLSSSIACIQDVRKLYNVENIQIPVEIIFSEDFNNTIGNETVNSLVENNTNDFVEKFKLVYGLIVIQFLIHFLVYEIINIILQYTISSIFRTLTTSESAKFQQSSNLLLDVSSILLLDESKNKTSGNQLFSSIVNFCEYLLNVMLSFIFHAFYGFLMYTYINCL